MPRPSNADKLAKVHGRFLDGFKKIVDSVYDVRKECLADRRFCDIAGAQWEGELSEQFANKPQFEINKTHLAVLRIENEYRNNRVGVDFVSRDGVKHDELADTLDGLLRADEQDSGANEAYDNAFSEGIRGGFGAWRLRADYENEEDEDDTRQRIKIEPIYEADSCVFFDADARRQDKKDAKHCYVLIPMTPAAYREEFGEDPQTLNREVASDEFDWVTPDIIYVAEYYEVEDKNKEVLYFKGIEEDFKKYSREEYDEDAELQQELESTGYELYQTKQVKKKRVHKYLCSGGKVLNDYGLIAGSRIPIVPFFGKRFFIDGKERCMGHVRLSKDPQRIKNMQISMLGEISAYSTIEKPIFYPEQTIGQRDMWADDTIKQYPFLHINMVKDLEGNPIPAGPIAYTKPPQIPPALAALVQMSEQDMMDILGNAQNAEEVVSNISGKAVEMIQNRLDMQSYIYMSNFAKAMQCSGEIWLSMAKEVYVEPNRKMKTVGLNGEVDRVELQRPVLGENGEVTYENDLSQANMDVVTEVGPTYRSQRESINRSLTGILQVTQDPETQRILQSVILMNLDGEGLGDIREYYRKQLVNAGVYQPTEEDKKRMEEAQANAKPDANQQLAQAMAKEAEAKAMKAMAETEEKIANTELTKAKTLDTLSQIDSQERNDAMQAIKLLMSQLGIRPAEMGEGVTQ